MNIYDTVLFVHIAAAVVLVGGSLVATPAIRSATRRAGSVDELRLWLSFGRPFKTIDPVSSLTLVASGAYLATAGNWWAHAWVQAATAARKTPAGPVTAQLDALRSTRRWSATANTLLANDLAPTTPTAPTAPGPAVRH
jgi:hypothetical protein